MCHFDLPGLKSEPETAEKYKKVDGSLTVLPTVQSRKVEIIKVVPPLKSPFPGLMMAKKVLHFDPSSQSYEVSKIGVPLFEAKVLYF